MHLIPSFMVAFLYSRHNSFKLYEQNKKLYFSLFKTETYCDFLSQIRMYVFFIPLFAYSAVRAYSLGELQVIRENNLKV